MDGKESIVIASLFLLALSGSGAEAKLGRAVLQGTNVVSLGAYPAAETRTVRIGIRNAGEGELRIQRVITTCSCLRVDDCSAAIAPGQVGEIGVTLERDGEEGPFSRSFYIETSDPGAQRIRIEITGNATGPRNGRSHEKRIRPGSQ